MGDLRSHFRLLQARRDAKARRSGSAARVDDRNGEDQAYRGRQQEETLTAIKQALAATPPHAYTSVDPELKARQIFEATGLSGRAGAYEEILAAVKAAVARANSPEAMARRFLDAKALADAAAEPDHPAVVLGMVAGDAIPSILALRRAGVTTPFLEPDSIAGDNFADLFARSRRRQHGPDFSPTTSMRLRRSCSTAPTTKR